MATYVKTVCASRALIVILTTRVRGARLHHHFFFFTYQFYYH